MNKNVIIGIILAVAVLGVASGAYFLSTPSPPTKPTVTTPTVTKPAVPEQTTLRIGSYFEPLSLDPVHSVSGALWCVTRNVYEGLLKYKGTGTEEYDPLLATSWTMSSDAKVFTFNLRQNVKFHDGTMMNAEAVKFSFERLIGTKRAPSVYFKGIDKIDVVSEYVIRFTLKEPSGVFLKDLASLSGWVIMSPTAVKANAKSDDPWAEKWLLENSAGTGPYKIAEWVRENRVVLTKFDGYWGGWKPGQIERVVMQLIREAASQRMLLEKGDIDIAENLSMEDQEILKKMKGITDMTPTEFASSFVVLFDVTRPPFDDVIVRRAVSYATDYETYVKLVLGVGKPGASPIPQFMKLYWTGKYGYKYDPKKAAELLDEAGWKLGSDGFRYKGGNKFAISYLYSTGDEFRRKVGEQLKNDFLKVGISVDIIAEPVTVTTGRLLKGEKPAHIYIQGLYGYGDPTGYLLPVYLQVAFPSWNLGNYKNAKVEELVPKLIATADVQERIKICDELQRILCWEDPASIYLLELPEIYSRLVRDWVQGRVYNPAYWRALNIYDMWKGYP